MSNQKVVMLPRKILYAWVVSYVVLLVLILASFQYTNYVDRRSNSLWCGVIDMFGDKYQPSTESGKALKREFAKIREGYNCDKT